MVPSLHPDELTMYCITARHGNTPVDIGDGDGLLVLGKTAADREAERVMCWPAVTAVATEAFGWGSADERAVLLDAYFNGVDVAGPVAHLAAEHGVPFDGDPFSANEVLAKLRAMATAGRAQVLAR